MYIPIFTMLDFVYHEIDWKVLKSLFIWNCAIWEEIHSLNLNRAARCLSGRTTRQLQKTERVTKHWLSFRAAFMNVCSPCYVYGNTLPNSTISCEANDFKTGSKRQDVTQSTGCLFEPVLWTFAPHVISMEMHCQIQLCLCIE